MKTGTYDYIIVGAGSAGCVLAERLSAGGSSRVLLLEAGDRDTSPWISMPKGVAKLVNSPKHTWVYRVSQPRLAGEAASEVWIRGRVLGGSSSINGMIWSRGEPADYDDWARAGAQGWDSQTMLAAFKAIENHALGASDTRGSGGPVHVSPGEFRYPLAEKMIEGGKQLGLRYTDDLNSISGDRVGYYSHNIWKGRRQSSATAFLEPARRRRNLEVLTDALVTRIAFDQGRAARVEARVAGQSSGFDCNGEIILSAGALESPRLLQLSGIGPAEHLRSLGVEVVHDSPDVGARMREHLAFSMPYRLRRDVGINRSFHGIGLLKSTLQYYTTHKGILASGPFEVGAFVNVAHPDRRPDAQLYLSGYTFALSEDRHPVPLADIDRKPGLSIYGQLLRLTSEGSIRITSADPDAPPEITPNWLATEYDQRAAVAVVRYMRRYVSQSALADEIEEELLPGSRCQSDEDILTAFRQFATCGLHAIGSCRMGSDPRSVVDERLRVRGVRNLRVVDCSVMPAPVTGNTNAPAMAAAYHAASLILEDRPRLAQAS